MIIERLAEEIPRATQERKAKERRRRDSTATRDERRHHARVLELDEVL